MYCKLEFKLPFNKIEDKQPKLESIFHKLPLYFILDIDLEAVCLLVNLPDASNLNPVICLYLRLLIIYLFKFFLVFKLKRFTGLPLNTFLLILILFCKFVIKFNNLPLFLLIFNKNKSFY